MRVERVSDLRKGRRLPVPTFVASDELLQVAIVKSLENRFYVRNQQGTLRERLDRCRAAAKRYAASKKKFLDEGIKQFRALAEQRFADMSERSYELLFIAALSGKGAAPRLSALEKHIRNLDGDLYFSERAPELLAAVLYQYYRLGFNSPTVAEQLNLTPCQVRQILFRANRVARATTLKPRARLNRAMAEEIRRLSASGMSRHEIAAKFGAARETVQRIVKGETWRDRRHV